MDTIYFAVALFLLLNIVGGIVRVLIGPDRGDRMLSAQLFATAGVAIILLLAEAMHLPSLRDVALILVLLSVINTVVFVRYVGTPGIRRPERET